jgi:hypothetical protein
MLSNHDDVFEIEDPQAKRSAKLWSDIVAWTFPVIGIVALELGTPLWVGLLIACLKFGWRDFLAAWWLRSDPLPQRGKSLSWILAARGCFLVSFGGAAISMLGLLVGMLTPPDQRDPQSIAKIVIMGAIVVPSSWTLGFILMSMGCSFSVRHQIRVWIDDSLYAALRERNWNRVCSLNKNSFPGLCGPPMLHAVVIGGPFALIAFSTGQFAWLLATAATVLGSIEIWRARRSAALVPEDCWKAVEPANSLSSSDKVTSEYV